MGDELAFPAARPVAHARDSPDFDQWVADVGPELMRFATVVTGNHHDAGDAVQEALLAILPRWRRLSEHGSPEAYARRIIVNRRITWWRRIGRHQAASTAGSALEHAAPTSRIANADALSDAVLADRLLRSLPVQQRAAVALRYVDDLPFAEIAEILGCTESTARSHVHRALARLRTQLGDSDDD